MALPGGLVVVASLCLAAPAWAELPVAAPLSYTGHEQTYVVPAGVTWLAITAAGAPGWDTTTNQTGSVGDNNDGYEVYGMLAVTPGESLFTNVGQAGLASGAATFGGGGAGGSASAASGGSGGGASDVRTSTSLASRLIVGAGGGGSGGSAASNAPSGDFINSLGGDGCTEGETLHSCATESVAGGTVIEGGEAYAGNSVSGYTPATGGTETAGVGSVIPESTMIIPSETDCIMSGSAAGSNGSLGLGGTGGSGNQNGGGGGGGGYYGGGGGGSGRTATPGKTGGCNSPRPYGVGVGGGTGSSFLSSALVNTSFEGDEENSGNETNAEVILQPLIQLTSPANGATYVAGQVVHASYDCYLASYPENPYCQGSELASGASSTTSVASGAAIDTITQGKHTFTVKNAWASGPSNVETTVTYTVIAGKAPPPMGPTAKCSISGATGKHPKLTVKVSDASGIRSLSIHAPSGISFGKRGVLVVKLKHSETAVTVRGRALVFSKKVASKVKKKKLKSAKFKVEVTVVGGGVWRLSPTAKL